MPDAKSPVLVIDDDPDLRASVGRLLRSVGLETQLFASISDFLKSDPPDGPTCLVLDVRLPGQSGLDFQRELAAANRELPIIFITGHRHRLRSTLLAQPMRLACGRRHFGAPTSRL